MHDTIRSACLFAVIAVLGASAFADIPPPPPQRGFKRVPYEHVLKLATELPEYKFYPFQRLGLGGEEKVGEELQLSKDTGVPVASSSSPSVRTGVVAVPRKVMEDLGTKEKLAKLLSRDNKDKLPAGVVIYETRGTIQDLKNDDPRSKVENVITVSPDETAGVKFKAAESPGPAKKDAAAPSTTKLPTGTLIGSIALALAVVTLGGWYVRKK
jgi:hypothetical protein